MNKHSKAEQTEVLDFELHAARAFFGSAWADQCEEFGDAAVLSGREILDVMPETIDPAALHAASTLRFDIERVNGKTIHELMVRIGREGNGDRPNTAEMFGHYSAMQAMGHGVGLHDAFGFAIYKAIRVPHVEFGMHSLERDYFSIEEGGAE